MAWLRSRADDILTMMLIWLAIAGMCLALAVNARAADLCMPAADRAAWLATEAEPTIVVPSHPVDYAADLRRWLTATGAPSMPADEYVVLVADGRIDIYPVRSGKKLQGMARAHDIATGRRRDLRGDGTRHMESCVTDLADIVESFNRLGSVRAVSKELGIPRTTVARKLAAARQVAADVAATTEKSQPYRAGGSPADREILKLRDENRRLKTEMETLHRAELDDEITRHILGVIARAPEQPPEWLDSTDAERGSGRPRSW